MVNIVIVGGGFGGLALARSLKTSKHLKVTLISDRHGFRYAPALYRTATGFTMRASAVPLKKLTADIPNLQLLYGRAAKLDASKRYIVTSTGLKLHYDYLVLSLGSVPNYFGIPGVDKHAYTVGSPHEIFRLRKHLHDHIALKTAEDKNYVVVGAGATGVEIAAGLASYVRAIARRHKVNHPTVRIELLDGADRLLPGLSKYSSGRVRRRLKSLNVHFRPNSLVRSESPDSLITNKRKFATNTVVWSAGFKTNPFYARHKHLFGLDNRGKVHVDSYMRAQERVFVIGDNAGTPYSGYAQTAVHDAHYVARQFKRLNSRRRLKRYRPRRPVSVVPVGRKWAALEYGKLKFAGRLAFIARDVADLVGYADVMPLSLALKVWHGRNDTEEYCTICKK